LERKGLEKNTKSRIPVHKIFLPLDLGVKMAAIKSSSNTKVRGMAKKLRN
jgi:hypothetical protein